MKLSVLGLLGLSTAIAAPINVPAKRALPRLGGLNIAGCDFGMNVWGWSGTSMCPGTEQIGHFIEQGSNVIRLPVGWQYLVNDRSSTALDAAFFATYDALVQEVTGRGAYAIIDIHNYGRWDSGVVGVDGPSNEAFASLWSLLARKYATNDKVMFGLMNEPHDQDIGKFAVSCQAAVDAIRAAGATTQSIILPGNRWTKAEEWTSGANAPMMDVTDPAGGVDRLILDVHKYLDADGSGTAHECVTDGLDVLAPFAEWLKAQGRRAIITEMGGATTDSCQNYLPKMLQFVVDNDVFVGFTAWAAGSFQPYPDYELSLTPNADGSDNALWAKAIKPFLPGNSGAAPSSTSATPVASSSQTSSSAVPSSSSEAVSSPSPTLPPVLVVTSVPTSSYVPSTSAWQESYSSALASSASASASASSAAASSSVVSKSTSAAQSSSSAAQSPSSAAQPPSSAAQPSSSAAQPSSSSAASSAAASSAAPVSSSATTSSITTTPTATADNYQKYTGALGGIPAPEVTKSSDKYHTNGQAFNFLIEALNRSCYTQMDRCQLSANVNGNVAPLTVANCNGTQIKACLSAASATGI